MLIKRTLMVLAFGLIVLAADHVTKAVDANHPDEDELEISRKCAAVLFAAGSSLGAAATYALTPVALCSAGFCSTGIAGGSFASWWQSTMPLVAKGSLFAKLQAIAMTAAGGKIAISSGAVVGGATSLHFMTNFCQYVDDTDPDTSLGQMFTTSENVVIKAINLKDVAEKLISDFIEGASSGASSMWNSIAATASDAKKSYL